MWFELLLYGGIGLLLIVLGLLIWRKRKITLIHDYHWKNVRKKDVGPYTRQMGIGLILMGAGIGLTGLVNVLTRTQKGLWSFALGFLAGLIVMGRAQRKYNGSWLG